MEIVVSGGHGGAGKASYFRKGTGPDGGNGGAGGDLYIAATSDVYALSRLSSQKTYLAPAGQQGQSNKKTGHDGEDLEVYVPVGTDLLDRETGEKFSLDRLGDRILICKGGIGGLGNADLKSARMTTPIHAQHGLPGQSRRLVCHLRLIADFGLVGLPNTGKSSLLNELTAANAKIGDYPFTTLEPNLGAFNGRIIADIPGLIEGASGGKGLGTKFLKHIEKVPVIIHCVAADSPDPAGDYKIIRDELEEYNPELLAKKEIVVVTKTDLVEGKQLKTVVAALRKVAKKVVAVSILDDQRLGQLKKILSS